MAATTFTQAQVKRAVQGAIKGGLTVAEVKIEPDGTIRILPESSEQQTTKANAPEPW